METAKPFQLAVKKVLSRTMSLHSMSHHTIPPLESKMYPLQLNASACMYHVCLLQNCASALGEEKHRYQSKATMLLLLTPPHVLGMAGIIGGV